MGLPPLVSWNAPLHFLQHRWLHRFGRYTHSHTQVLSSLSCSSETLLRQPTRRPVQLQALISILSLSSPSPSLCSQPAAWGPSLDHNSSLQSCSHLSPLTLFLPFRPLRARTPWSRPLSPGCWGCRRMLPHPISLQSQSPGVGCLSRPLPGPL